MNESSLAYDALTEVFNVGLSRAATQLSELLDDQILIDIPHIQVLELDQVAEALDADAAETVCGVVQRMQGMAHGAALLVFHTEEAQTLLKALVGAVPSLLAEDMRKFEHEAISEIGNIIISSSVSTMADLLQGEIELSIPEYIEDRIDALIHPYIVGSSPGQILVVVMRANLRASQRAVSGSLVMLLGVNFVGRLLRSLGLEECL